MNSLVYKCDQCDKTILEFRYLPDPDLIMSIDNIILKCDVHGVVGVKSIVLDEGVFYEREVDSNGTQIFNKLQ